jgi:hypothetical protein
MSLLDIISLAANTLLRTVMTCVSNSGRITCTRSMEMLSKKVRKESRQEKAWWPNLVPISKEQNQFDT